MREMTQVGPFAELARIIEVFLADRTKAGLILVTLPEALPINESLELRAALRRDGSDLDAIVVNMVERAPLPDVPEWDRARKSLLSVADPELDALVDAVGKAVARHHTQTEVLAALAEGMGGDIGIHQLPRIGHGSIDSGELGELRDLLAPLGVS
jgi:anion-transporting  ArsA/GET3 family ATPase